MPSINSNPRSALRLVPVPLIGHAVTAPPVLTASSQTTDFVCGQCETVLLHAEEGQVHGLFTHCTQCGSYNSTDA